MDTFALLHLPYYIYPTRSALLHLPYYICNVRATWNSPECGAMQDVKKLGKQYVQHMRAKVQPPRSNATHVVDKMLRNSWNIGYISMMLPQACIIQVQPTSSH